MAKKCQIIFTLEERNPVEIAYNEIDAAMDALVESGILVLNVYQYLVGSLLAFNILDKADREYSNKIMIDITNHLEDYSIDSITRLFEIDLYNEEKKGFQKNKTAHKK